MMEIDGNSGVAASPSAEADVVGDDLPINPSTRRAFQKIGMLGGNKSEKASVTSLQGAAADLSKMCSGPTIVEDVGTGFVSGAPMLSVLLGPICVGSLHLAGTGH